MKKSTGLVVALASAVGFGVSGWTGCASPPAPAEIDWLPADAHAGVEHPGLAGLLDDHWAWTLEQNPIFATQIDVHAFDDRLGDFSYARVLAGRAKQATFLERIRQLQRDPSLSASDATTLEILASKLEHQAASEVCELALWSVDPHLGNLLNLFNRLTVLHTVESQEDGANLVARYRAMPQVVRDRIANLRLGLERGYVANAAAVEGTAKLIEEALAAPELPLMAPADAERPDWPAGGQQAFASELRATVEETIRPALAGYAEFLRREVLPRARDAENEGVAGIPNGEACYRARVRQLTTLPNVTPRELHQLGLNEISWLNAEMLTIGEKELGETELGPLMWRLRLDPGLQFPSEEAIVASAEEALTRARAAIPSFFGTLPKAECEVVPVPAYRAPTTPAGYYSMTGPADARIGHFYVNTHLPNTRPRFGIESLTYHESIPGHHLQIALSQELAAVPAFRKYSVSIAFSEGWGLYAERLAVDMKLYSSPLARLGQLNNEAWRAARLVVDTGLHALGWTREDSIQFMLGHTALPEHDIETEVGRYIANPGQALAYKAGQLEILKLRKRSREVLGNRFDIRGFHDAVLLGGAVPLPVLRKQVESWTETMDAMGR